MIVRLAILSDLHFASAEASADATHMILSREAVAKQNPAKDLIDMIEAQGLRADVVLCPGDITFQAESASLRSAWAYLNQVTASLEAMHLFAATGNHDISSRGSDDGSSPEMWETLKQLDPRYPHPQGDPVERLHYWAEHFLVADVLGIRVVVLNTCNSHARGRDEYSHGRVTDYTISRIESQIQGMPALGVNILLCHHHPMRHPDLSQRLPDYSDMKQGQKLLERLEATDRRWLVVHGHKHSPRLDYAQGDSADNPVVLSAGSFSAVLSPAYFPAGRNQFYIVEIDLDYVEENGLAGIVHAWDWVEGVGWEPSYPDAGAGSRKITTGSGFGHRANPIQDAVRIAEEFNGQTRIEWSSVIEVFPWIRYVTKRDLKKILDRLASHHGLRAISAPGSITPAELVREAA